MTEPNTKLAPNGRPLAEVYREAARIVRNGWSRYDYATTRNGAFVKELARGECFCASGALAVAGGARQHPIGAGPHEDDEADLLGPLVRSLAEDDFAEDGDPCDRHADVASWNKYARSADDVAERLDRVASEIEGP